MLLKLNYMQISVFLSRVKVFGMQLRNFGKFGTKLDFDLIPRSYVLRFHFKIAKESEIS